MPLEVSGSIRIGNSNETCVSGLAGGLRYLSGTGIQYCDGASWNSLLGTQSPSPPTAPSGSGYFVLSHDSYDGNLGGQSGAHAKCLADLTTNTGWSGYSDANSRGLLVSGKVGAFLCYGGYNNPCVLNLLPLTTYYFSNAQSGMGSAGGASFTTDAGGHGPNDSVSWGAANRFGGAYLYWQGPRTSNSDTLWSVNSWSSDQNCNGWTSNGAGLYGLYAASSNTDKRRWENAGSSTCDQTHLLICYVNP